MNGEKGIYYWKKIQWINFSDEKYFHGPKSQILDYRELLKR